MRKFIILFFVLYNASTVFSQNSIKGIIKDSETKEPVVGATALVQGSNNGARTDINGSFEIKNIPDGKQIIIFNIVGYEKTLRYFQFSNYTNQTD